MIVTCCCTRWSTKSTCSNLNAFTLVKNGVVLSLRRNIWIVTLCGPDDRFISLIVALGVNTGTKTVSSKITRILPVVDDGKKFPLPMVIVVSPVIESAAGVLI